MSERDSPVNGIERRGVLAALATGLGGVGFARSSLARRIDALDASQFVLEQGDRCVPITPLSGEETVEEFYDYRTPFTSPSGDAYSSYGTTDLQRPETSICFLYDGPEGVSLVVVHDALEDGTSGGAVTFRFDGLTGGSWVVGDDDYDAASNYDTFAETDDGWRVDWTWAESRSDGGVYRPLGDEFAVTIHPGFNEDAELYGDPYEGEITDWQVLSGDRSDPERVSLALDQPITIRVGLCDGTTPPTTPETTQEQETTDEEQETTEEESTDEEQETTEEDAEEDQSTGTVRPELEIVPDEVNPRSHGRLPVVVHSTAEFEATAIESGSVSFGPDGATPVHRTRTDTDGDDHGGLKLHFWMDDTGIDWGTDAVELTGRTTNGRAVVGETEVQLVSRGGDEEEEGDEESEDHDDRENEDDDGREADEEREREREEDDDEEADDDDEEDDDRDDSDEEDDEADEEDDDDEDDGDDEDDEDDHDDRDESGGRGRGRGEDHDGGRGRGEGRGRGKGKGEGHGRGEGRGRGGDD